MNTTEDRLWLDDEAGLTTCCKAQTENRRTWEKWVLETCTQCGRTAAVGEIE